MKYRLSIYRYIDTFEKYQYRYRYRYGEVENIDIDKVILENIDIDIDLAISENIDIDIDKANLQNIDIDKISNRFKFGISNRAMLETTWGLLVQYLEANLVTNLGLLQDTLVTTRGLLRDNLGLLGILLVNTCDLLMEYLGGYFGTT